jgi:transcriptional regulator with XRE-family HTH domain
MISVRQIRAARGFLGWSQGVLADKARLSRSAVARLELEETAPHADTIEAIHRALTAHGIVFVDDPSNGLEGVQLRVAPRRPKRA